MSLGDVVLYTLNVADAEKINEHRRVTTTLDPLAWDARQTHVGNEAAAGQVFPMVVVREWSEDCVNGQLLLDGSDTFWVTSRTRYVSGLANGHWQDRA